MPSPAEIAYREAVRALEDQAQDVANIRSHVSLVLSAGGIAAVVLGAQTGRGVAFWLAAPAFAAIAGITIRVFWPVELPRDFNGYQLVTNYVDADPSPESDFMMRELAIYASDDYDANSVRLGQLFMWQSAALLLFGTEVGLLLFNLAVE